MSMQFDPHSQIPSSTTSITILWNVTHCISLIIYWAWNCVVGGYNLHPPTHPPTHKLTPPRPSRQPIHPPTHPPTHPRTHLPPHLTKKFLKKKFLPAALWNFYLLRYGMPTTLRCVWALYAFPWSCSSSCWSCLTESVYLQRVAIVPHNCICIDL